MRTKPHFRSSLLRTRKAHRRKPLNTTFKIQLSNEKMTTCPWVKLPPFFETPDRLNEWTRATRALAYNYTRHSQDDLLFSIEEYKKSLVVVSIDLKIKAFWKASFTLQTINLFLVRWKPWFFLRRFHLSDPPKLRRACLQSSSSSR